MHARFIARILDPKNVLLAWAEVPAEAKPQPRPAASCPFWPVAPTRFVVEQAGRAVRLAIHWPDLDVARIEDLPEPTDMTIGQIYTYHFLAPVWLVPGMRDVPLPQVTERRDVTIGIPTGSLAAEGHF